MITNRERERQTLSFQAPIDRGAVEETFYPWTLTKEQFAAQGMPQSIADGAMDAAHALPWERYFPVSWGQGVMEYERWLGFDPVRRIGFVLPFRSFPETVLKNAPAYTIVQDMYGRTQRRDKVSGGETELRPVIETEADWARLRLHAQRVLDTTFTDEAIDAAYRPLREGQLRGDYSVRLNLEGFFWVPRELMGIEQHLYNFYDAPALIHKINEYMLEIYTTKLMKVLDVVLPDVVYFMEDLSGKNGAMISGDMFNTFVGAYYKRLIPLLREKGVENIFVDTDGDFKALIPHFMAAGVDGFLPMDVNAGMDIVQMRQQYPTLKFIGGYNKLCIAEGAQAIDAEFERILPVVRGGGYLVGADHQVAPSTSLAQYRYYVQRLKEVMAQSGADLA